MEGGQSLEETHVVTPMFKGKSSADEGGIDCIWLYITDLQLMIIYACVQIDTVMSYGVVL